MNERAKKDKKTYYFHKEWEIIFFLHNAQRQICVFDMSKIVQKLEAIITSK